MSPQLPVVRLDALVEVVDDVARRPPRAGKVLEAAALLQLELDEGRQLLAERVRLVRAVGHDELRHVGHDALADVGERKREGGPAELCAAGGLDGRVELLHAARAALGGVVRDADAAVAVELVRALEDGALDLGEEEVARVVRRDVGLGRRLDGVAARCCVASSVLSDAS